MSSTYKNCDFDHPSQTSTFIALFSLTAIIDTKALSGTVTLIRHCLFCYIPEALLKLCTTRAYVNFSLIIVSDHFTALLVDRGSGKAFRNWPTDNFIIEMSHFRTSIVKTHGHQEISMLVFIMKKDYH